VIETTGAGLVNQCRRNVTAFRRSLNIPVLREAGWSLDGDDMSPLMHIRAESGRSIPHGVCFDIQRSCLEKKILVAAPRYVTAEAFRPEPNIRIVIPTAHDKTMIEPPARSIAEILLAHSQPKV
jgi:hypothetical protein